MKQGEKLIASSGCIACHSGAKQANTFRTVSLAEVSKKAADKRGCLAESEASAGVAPRFGLGPKQRNSIVAFLTSDMSSLDRDEPGEFAERQYAAMRCGSCHTRDGVEPALLTTLASEFKPPAADADEVENGVHLAPDQTHFPSLTWAGEKLRPEWARDFISGKVSHKPRPYLRARMPAFKTRADRLATGFAAQHGLAPTSVANPAPDPKLAPIGKKLLGTVGGFSCVQCHPINGAAPLGAFEAPGVDLGLASQRLRKDFYHRWVMDPLSLEPTTKMPRYADDEGKTALRDAFDGDATQQFEAIWQSLLHGDALQRPQ